MKKKYNLFRHFWQQNVFILLMDCAYVPLQLLVLNTEVVQKQLKVLYNLMMQQNSSTRTIL